MQRRTFLTTAVGAAGFVPACSNLLKAESPAKPAGESLRFGLIADLHHNMFKRDQLGRMKAFVDAANVLIVPEDRAQ